MFNFLLKGSDQSPADEVPATASAATASAADPPSALSPDEVMKVTENVSFHHNNRHDNDYYHALTALTAVFYHFHSNCSLHD
jgi:hypothetical protein